MNKLFDSRLEVVSRSKEFPVRRHGSQIIIECYHPGRGSDKWRERLKTLIKKSLES